MATLKTQSTALANALHKAHEAQIKPLQTTLDSASVIHTKEDLKEFTNAVHAMLISKGWVEGSANAQRSKLRRILGTMTATDSKMVKAHDISNREQGTQLVIELATDATNISDLYNALAPAKPEAPKDADAVGSDAEQESAEPLDREKPTLTELVDTFEAAALLSGYTLDEIADAVIARYGFELAEAA